MMVAFFSIFPFCGLIVGWIILLLYTHFVRKKNDTSDVLNCKWIRTWRENKEKFVAKMGKGT